MSKLIQVLALPFVWALSGCTRNVDYVKLHGPARLQELGYTTAIYEGYHWGLAGGDVWFTMKRADSPGVIYTGYLTRWGDELQLYGPNVVSGNQIHLKGCDE